VSEPLVPHVSRTPGSADFFDAAAAGKLLLRKCNNCSAFRGPQDAICPQCHTSAHATEYASGEATLVSWAVVHRSPLPELQASTPYVAGIVEVAEGPWLVVRVLTAPDETVHAGTALEIWVAPGVDGGESLPMARTRPAQFSG